MRLALLGLFLSVSAVAGPLVVTEADWTGLIVACAALVSVGATAWFFS